MIMLSFSEVRFSLADIYTTPCFFFFWGGGGVYKGARDVAYITVLIRIC